jgi:hypothetical protein
VLAVQHRVSHRAEGEPCRRCGLPHGCHRAPGQRRRAVRAEPIGKRKKAPPAHWTYLGLDGEGRGRARHAYILLACSDKSGKFKECILNETGLSTEECLEFLLTLVFRRTKLFAYAFGYDLTKILTDVDSETLYKLFRPEERQRPKGESRQGPYSVEWRGYRLNLQGSKFVLEKGKRKVVIWDVFRFFQSKFVSALQDWKVGYPELWKRMQIMKDKRDEFDKTPLADIKRYCFEECACMAELAERLTLAHGAVGLRLRSYYGAGSSADAMLKVMGIKEQIRIAPTEMNDPVSRAFFGGRFEMSRLGKVEGKITIWDISSAYPYQCIRLPCLVHGTWELTRARVDLDRNDIAQALVRYSLSGSSKASWGPFPFRMKDGSICFPSRSGGGWVYLDEYRQGEKFSSSVRFHEAWILKKNCECVPFHRIAEYYCERCRIGKEGPGIVLKLGCNSCYGKLAQSVGNAIYNSWLWAGMITSGTRAQLLELIGLHQDPGNVLMTATDGLATLEDIAPPSPIDTGTAKTEKPLGGWESKTFTKGMFFARPGIYFPLHPTKDEIKTVRGRGIGKAVVLENWHHMINLYEQIESLDETVNLCNITRFCGAKSSISRSGKLGDYRYKRACGRGSQPSYGQWITRPVEMSFNPMPKRQGILGDSKLLVRRLPSDLVSAVYSGITAEEALEIKAAEAMLLEQPDGDLTEYQ